MVPSTRAPGTSCHAPSGCDDTNSTASSVLRNGTLIVTGCENRWPCGVNVQTSAREVTDAGSGGV